jgi:protein SCO1
VPKLQTVALLAACCVLSGCARRYRVDGLVLRTDPAARSVTVSHRDIPGYMPAMTMPFRVRRARELAGLKPGMRVSFDLAGGYARRIRVRQASTGDIKLPEPVGRIAIGAPVPDFTLTDQTGRSVRLSDFRGRMVAIDFIYTRCPLPEVCPRLSANFARLQRRFGQRLVLLSLTLDPQYDTPAVLTEYARIWGANPSGWHFLTGSRPEIERIAGGFGMVYWPEEGSIVHTSQTGLIAKDGTLAAVVEGSTYQAGQLMDLIESLL